MGYKKFCLVYEPKYKNKQVIIDFTNYEEHQKIVGIETEKYSGISTAKKGKFYLSEIDKFTNSFDGINDIVRLITPFDQIHTFFIGLPYNGYINIINPVFRNQSILNLAMKTYRDVVEDQTVVNRLVEELINIDSDFYKFYLNSEYYKTLSIKNTILQSRYYQKNLQVWPDIESKEAFIHSKQALTSKAKQYHICRGILLAYNDYSKKEKPSDPVSYTAEPLTGDQLTIPGFPKIKKN